MLSADDMNPQWRYRAWAQSWSSAALAARSVLPSNRPATPLFSPACWELGFQACHARGEGERVLALESW